MLGLRRRREGGPGGGRGTKTVELYYASDVHGSDQCWRKFLGAARFYGVDALVMGGDLTGKAVVPITQDEHGVCTATFIGELRTASTPAEVADLEAAIRFNGMYPWVASAEEVERHRTDPDARAALFDHVMVEELRQWIALADERMSALDVPVYVMPGNDDPWSCDPVIEGSSWVQACDDRVVRVGPHEMISCAYANPTPWRSPRELDEDSLYTRLTTLADQLEEPATSIFNLHVPPYDSGLDTANEMNDDLTLVYRGGQPNPVPVGSHAVRQIIEEFQPLVSLHGHIHESRGETTIARTLALNSGSEYNSGHIHGVVVRLDEASVVGHQFVVG
jgi:Icc-related predicted phosphoesterase